MKTTTIVIVLCALLPISVLADWPTQGGNSLRNGQVPFVGPDDATLRWTFNDPCLFAGPIYAEGDYAAMMRFNTIDYSPIVCLNANTGAELWTLDLPGTQCRSLPIGFNNGHVYGLGFRESGEDTLYALNPTDGSVIWTAEAKLHQGIIASAAFADNGDLIVNAASNTASNALTRIDYTTGETIWQTDRVLSVVGGSEHVCVLGNRIYGWQGGAGQVEFTAWTTDTGTELYGISLPGGAGQQIPFTVAADTAIYVIRDSGNLYRLRDTGAGFEIVWSQQVEFGSIQPVGCHLGVLSDGDVIVPHGTRVKRHNVVDGSVVATSDALTATAYMGYPRFAIDNDDTIYMSTSTSDGVLYALSPDDLAEVWSFPISLQHYAGPCLGQNGDIISAGAAGVYCFEGEGAGNQPPGDFTLYAPFDGTHLIDELVNHTIFFDWNTSIDPDNDPVTYTLVLENPVHTGDEPIVINDLTVSEYAFPDNLFDDNNWTLNDNVYNVSWLVVALDGTHAVMASNAPYTLDYEIAPQEPTDFGLLSPPDGSQMVNEYPIYFTWEESIDYQNGLHYDLILDEVSGMYLFDPIVLTGLTDTVRVFESWEFNENGWTWADGILFDIEWTVRAIGGEDTTWAENGPFELSWMVGVDEDGTASLPQNEMLIYPNPANAQATVSVTLARPSDVTLTVTDVLGRQVELLPQGRLTAGVYRVPLALNHYPSGTYMVRVDAGSALTQTKRLVVVK